MTPPNTTDALSAFLADPTNKPLAIRWGVLDHEGEPPINTSGAVDAAGMLQAFANGQARIASGEQELIDFEAAGVQNPVPLSDAQKRTILDARFAALTEKNNGVPWQGFTALLSQRDISESKDAFVVAWLHEHAPDSFAGTFPVASTPDPITTSHLGVDAPTVVNAPNPATGTPVPIPDTHTDAFPAGTTVVEQTNTDGPEPVKVLVASVPVAPTGGVAKEGKFHHVLSATGESIEHLASRVAQFIKRVL